MTRCSPLSLAVLLAALALPGLALPALAQQTVNLRDADVRAYIQDVARATGRSFIIDPRVQGKVTVVSERPLDQAGYFELFLSTLRANGLVVSPAAGGAFRVAPADGAATQPSGGIGRDRFETTVLRFNYIDAAAAIETLRPLVSREGQVTANRAGNAVIVADYADNVARVRALARQIDQDRAAVRVIALKHAGAREIATSLSQVAQGSAEGRGWQIAPVDASNSLVLRGDPATLTKLARIVADLDAAASAGADVRVIFLNHADAEKLVPVLQQLVGQPVSPASQAAPLGQAAQSAFAGNGQQTASGQPPQPQNTAPLPTAGSGGALGTSGFVPGASIGRGQAVIARYEGANALVIAAPADVQRRLGEVIRQLDVRREQVLVEAIIVEISDVAAQRLGVQFLLSGTGGNNIPFSVTNYSNASPNLLSVAGAVVAERRYGQDNATTVALRNAAVSSLLGATGGQFGFGGNLGSGAIFGFVVNAVKSDTASNVLSTPSVMALDNQQAHILVGQNVPLATGQALSNNFDNAFRTVQRQDIGIALDVRPQINAGNTIKLSLRQEVSSIASALVTDNVPDIILNKREISTTVTVDDGQIIALGGLIDENERRAIEKVPLLGDIPFLGNLFRSKSSNRTKTNLMVFIRPTIIRNAEDAARISGDRYQYVRAEQASREGSAATSLDALVRDYLKATPPGEPTASPPKPEPRP